MRAFISHSFADRAEFERLTDWLERVDVSYWRPSSVESAESLREQLRQAVGVCVVCIFIATEKSIRSSWCGAELGAFWGQGVPIIVYKPDLTPKEMLPPIVQGDVWEDDLVRVAIRTAGIINEIRYAEVEPRSPTATAPLAEITIGQLKAAVAEAVLLANSGESADVPTSSGEKVNLTQDAASSGREEKARQLGSNVINVDWRRRILWVDDRPANNLEECSNFESLGLFVILATSTSSALSFLKKIKFAAIISDMGRPEGPREGYKLLDAVRYRDPDTPFFFYAGSRSPDHRKEAERRGAQGVTNSARELTEMVVRVLPPRE